MEDLNLEKVCRACLSEAAEMLSIFNVNISRKLMACANVQVWKNDGLPSNICNKCAGNLHVAFQFKKRVERNDLKLRTYLEKLKEKEKMNQNRVTDISRVEIPIDHSENVEMNQQISETMPCVYVGSNIVGNGLTNVPMNHFLDQNQISYIQTGQNVQVISSYQPNLHTLSYPTDYNTSFTPLENPADRILTVVPVHEPNIARDTYEHKSDDVQHKESKAQEKQKRECPTCKKVFRSQNKLNRHVKIHSNDKQFECKICKKGFTHGGNFKIHMRIHTGERPFLCPVCGKAFLQAQDVTKHMRVHTGERPYKCTMCDKAFTTSSNLAAHKRTHTGERPYVCPWCNKGFCQSNELKKHCRVHTGEKSHICDICHKGFNGSSSMLTHRLTHMVLRKYQCPICEQSYKTPNVLHVHMKRHKRCSACNKKFKTLNEIKMHYFTMHGIIFEKLPAFDKITCHFCSLEFQDSQQFVEHLRQHLMK